MAERFPPVKPEDLSPEDRKLWEELTDIKDRLFGDYFVLKQTDGSFVGPMETAYALPEAFRTFIASALSLSKTPDLSKLARETAILYTGVYYNSEYEIYAHERLANNAGLTWRQISYMKQGKKPPADSGDALSEECDVAYDVAEGLLRGEGTTKGRLEDRIWDRAEKVLGKAQALGLVHYVGYYAYACLLMNGAGVGMPAGESVKESAL